MTFLCKHLASLVSHVSEGHDLPPYRIWRLENFDDDHTALELSGQDVEARATDVRIIEASSKMLEDEGVQTDDCFAVEFKKPSGWIVKEPPKIPITVAGRPGFPAPIFNSSEGFFNRMGTGLTKLSTTAVTSVTSTDDSYHSALTPMGKWKKKEKTLEPGTVGLGNMCVDSKLSLEVTLILSRQGKHLLHELCSTVPGAQPGTHRIFLEYAPFPLISSNL
jgi:ubiquitin carboxyl-terminal hydrolase 4/11/15